MVVARVARVEEDVQSSVDTIRREHQSIIQHLLAERGGLRFHRAGAQRFCHLCARGGVHVPDVHAGQHAGQRESAVQLLTHTPHRAPLRQADIVAAKGREIHLFVLQMRADDRKLVVGVVCGVEDHADGAFAGEAIRAAASGEGLGHGGLLGDHFVRVPEHHNAGAGHLVECRMGPGRWQPSCHTCHRFGAEGLVQDEDVQVLCVNECRHERGDCFFEVLIGAANNRNAVNVEATDADLEHACSFFMVAEKLIESAP